MLRWAAILVVVLAVLLGIGHWLAAERHAERAAKNAPLARPGNSDYYMKNATIYQLTPTGNLSYRAHSAEALHFPDGSAELTNVDVHYIAANNGFWDLHAAKGHVPAGQRNIYLYDGVHGHHPLDNGKVVRFVTTHAWVYPDRKLVTSDAKVKAFQPGETVTGNGMRVNLDTNTLNLLHNVHVTYAQ